MFNAHCHLELSHLEGAIPPGLPFVQWLEQIVQLKRSHPLEVSRMGVHLALRKVLEGGTTVILDIVSLETSELPLRRLSGPENGLRSLLFWELINFLPASAGWAVDRVAARQHFEGSPNPWHLHGLSPHAPYTTTPELLRLAAEKARELGQWLCIHAAETAEETQLFTEGRGPLREFLSSVLRAGWQAPGLRPIEYLDRCGCLGPRTLLVHCNDINDADVALIKRTGARVVMCPGTHTYFNRGKFPLEQLWRAGVPVYLGTDSLASNESLDMAREVELAARLCPKMPADALEALIDPARADDFFADAIATG